MFKAQVLRRSFSLFRRAPSSVAARHDGSGTFRVQRVRIQQPFFTTSRLIGSAAVAGGLYASYNWLTEEVEVEIEHEHQWQQVRRRQPKIPLDENGEPREGREVTDEEEDEEEYEDEEEDEEELDDGLLFLPTGFSRPKPRTFYRASDPEWQTFVRLAKDRPRINKIRSELVALVRNRCSKDPQFNLRLGNIDSKKGGIWIEVHFPDGPPIEYEQPGYELTLDLTLRKVARDIDQVEHKRLTNALLPTTVANSVYYDLKRRAASQWQDVKKSIGLQSTPSPPTAQGIVSALPIASMKSVPTNGTSADPSASASTSTSSSTPASSPQQPATSTSGPTVELFGLSLPDAKDVPTMDLRFFRTMMKKHNKPANIQPPRGTFVVSGLIEVTGERAKITLDVRGIYDPNIAKYVGIQAQVRSLTEFAQRPKGGR